MLLVCMLATVLRRISRWGSDRECSVWGVVNWLISNSVPVGSVAAPGPHVKQQPPPMHASCCC